jgi:hypothetical protein
MPLRAAAGMSCVRSLVPRLAKSASSSTSPIVSTAAGVSIIAPSFGRSRSRGGEIARSQHHRQ